MPSKRVKLGRSEISALFRSIQDEVHTIVTSLYDSYSQGSQAVSAEATEGLMLPSIFSRLAHAHERQKGGLQRPIVAGLSARKPRFLQSRSARLMLDTGFEPAEWANEAAQSNGDRTQQGLDWRGNRLVTELNRVLSQESVLKPSYLKSSNATSTAVLRVHGNSPPLRKVHPDSVSNADRGSMNVSNVGQNFFVRTRPLAEVRQARTDATSVSTVLDNVEQESESGEVAEKFRKPAGVRRGLWKSVAQRHHNGSLEGRLWDLEDNGIVVI